MAALAYGLGTRVIASDIGGLSKIVDHERDGLLVPPKAPDSRAAAIVRLLKDRELYRQMQTAQKVRCEEDLNWSNIARETVNVYRRVLDKRGID